MVVICDFNLKNINALQQKIMVFVDYWARSKKTPTPHTEILKDMDRQGVKSYSTMYAIGALIRKGYIRRAERMGSNRTYYVQLRGI